MDDLISRKAAVELAMKYCPDDDGFVQCGGDIRGLLDELENLPSAQPEQQEGEWIQVTHGRGGYECNRCNEYAPTYHKEFLPNYCHNCGADMMGEMTLPTYTITNSDPLPHWSNDFMGRAVTYTSKGFYRQEEIYGEGGTMYEHWNSPAQRFKIVKVRTDKKTGRAVFKFVNSKSGKALAAGGYAFFYVRIEPWQ